MGLLCLLLMAFTPHFNPVSQQWWMIGWPLLALLRILNSIIVYWECAPSGLRERRIWRIKDVQWDQVRQIGRWKPKDDTVAVIFARPAPLSTSGCIVADPTDRAGFLAALRQYAPLANFKL